MNKRILALLISAVVVIAAVCATILVFNHQKPSDKKDNPTNTVEAEDTDIAPVLELNYNNVAIGLDYSFTVSPKVTMSGEEVDEDIQYSFQLKDDAASDIVDIETTDKEAVLTGKKYGDTTFVVSAEYKDAILVKELNISVTDVNVMFDSPNMKMSSGCFQVNLGLVQTEKDVTSIVPEVRVYDEGKRVKNPKFKWANSNEDIADMDKSGKISAKSFGVAEITGTYEEAKCLIKVNVYRPEIEIEPVYIEKNKNNVISSDKWAGTKVEKVTFANKDVFKSQSGSNIQLNSEELPAIGTSGELVIQTDKVKYVTDSMVVTMAIYNEANLNNMAAVIKANKGEGYYALAKDIKCAGKYNSKLDVEFVGTFDGTGHVISNMTTSDDVSSTRGLLGKSLGGNGIVKNVAFVNAKHGGQGGFIATQAAGTIENVYIQISIGETTIDGYDGATSVLGSSTYGVFTTHNVIVEYLNTLPAEATTGYALWQLHYGYAKHQGLYVIGCDKVAYEENDLQGGLEDIYGAYVNYGEFVDAKNKVDEWEGKFWKVTNGIPYPVALGSRKATTPNVKIPTYVGTDSTVVLDGLTIYDRVITNSTMSKYGIKIKDGALVIPKNVPSGTVLNITVQSAFDTSKQTKISTTVLTSKKVSLDEVYAIETKGSKTFKINLSSKKSLLKGAKLTDVTIDGKNISDAKYRWKKLTVKTSHLGDLGEKSMQIYFKSGSKLIMIDVCVDACTLAIENEADLNKMGSIIDKNKGEGRYVLANDIKCKGKYKGHTDTEFNGVFEGHGFTIYNMTTSDETSATRGLIGRSLGARGVVKNTSFINAKHYGQGGFITTQASGTMENLYIQITVSDSTTDGYDGATSVLASSTYGVFNTHNVIVEYKTPLASDAKTGNALWQLHYSYAKHNGLYVIGESEVATTYNNLGGPLKDSYGAYINYGEFIQAKIDTKEWDSNFWTVRNNVPYPRRLGKRKAVKPNVSMPKYIGSNSQVKIDGLTVCDQVIISKDMKKYGLKVKDGYLLVPKKVPAGTKFKITVSSAFDSKKKTTITTTVLKSSVENVSKTYALEVTGSSKVTINLSNLSALKGNQTLTDATLAGKSVKGLTYKNGVVTFDRKHLGETGEKTLQLYFKSGSKLTIVNIKIDACTYAIENESDLNGLGDVINKNNGAGRYVLANDIKCKGIFTTKANVEFNGTFDGHGYTIYNMQTASNSSGYRGLLGTSLGANGVVRNTSFVNAKHSGAGAFIVTSASGLMENLYIQIDVSGCTVDGYDGATSVLASSTYGVFSTRNVVVEYMNPLPDNAKTGYALWQLHYSYAKHDGLYVIGEEEVAANYNDLGGPLKDSYGAYSNYGDYIKADVDTKWDSDFWKVTNKVPYPKRLGKRTATVPNVSIPSYTGQNSKVEIIGLTVCDYAKLSSAAKKAGVKLDKNIITIPKNIKAGTTIEVTVESAFDSSRKKVLKTTVIASEEVKLNGTHDIEKYNHKTADIDFGSQASKVSGATLLSVTMDGVEFKNPTFKNGKLTVDTTKITGSGSKTMKAMFKNSNKLITVTINADVCTYAIKNEDDLHNLAEAIVANGGDGRYVLANDITCTKVYDANISTPFVGTFDGRGHVIDQMTTSAREGADRGLLGWKLEGAGTVENVIFTNAKHGGRGGFIVTNSSGTVRNVFVQIDITSVVNAGYDDATSVLASSTYGVTTTNNVLVEYINPLATNSSTGHALWSLWYSYAKNDGLYVVGANKVATNESSLGGPLKDTYGAYMTFGDFAAAKIDFSKWNKSMWTVKNGIVYPTKLINKVAKLPEVSLPEKISPDSTTAIEGATLHDQVVLDAKYTKMGIKVFNNKLIVPADVPAGTVIEITVKSVFDSSKAVKVSTRVFANKNIEAVDTVDLAVYKKDTVAIDLAKYEKDLKDTELVSVKLNDKAFTKTEFKDNVLEVDTKSIDTLGQQTVTATFESEDALVTVKIPVDACTMTINTEEDLNNMPAVIEDNKGKGRYVLGGHIVCEGKYTGQIKTEFVGTFDGRGYGIYNFTTASEDKMKRGLLGAKLGGDGVIKNVSFFNASHGGYGGLIADEGHGLVENVYVSITMGNCNENGYEYATSSLVSSTVGVFSTKNVLVEYKKALPDNAKTGYPLWSLYYSYGKHNGFYAVGVDKIATQESSIGGPAKDIYGAYATYEALLKAVNFDSWKNDFWDVDKDGKPYPKKQTVFKTIDDTLYVGLNDEKATVDLTSIKDSIKDATLTKVSVDGVSLSAPSFKDNKVTFDMAIAQEIGTKNITMQFIKKDKSAVMVSQNMQLCTMVIRNKEDLDKFPAAITENNGEGVYVLGNDVQYTGEYDASVSTEFKGTLDGCGYGIYNFKTSSENKMKRGLIGARLGGDGVIKNLSLVNASHSGYGGLIADEGVGLLENIYVSVTMGTCNENGYEYATSSLISSTFGTFSTSKVIVEYKEPLADGAKTGYPLWRLYYSYAKHNGFYAVGADKIAYEESSLGGPLSDVYGAYDSYEALMQVEKLNWENNFWTMKDNKPVPKKLAK